MLVKRARIGVMELSSRVCAIFIDFVYHSTLGLRVIKEERKKGVYKSIFLALPHLDQLSGYSQVETLDLRYPFDNSEAGEEGSLRTNITVLVPALDLGCRLQDLGLFSHHRQNAALEDDWFLQRCAGWCRRDKGDSSAARTASRPASQ